MRKYIWNVQVLYCTPFCGKRYRTNECCQKSLKGNCAQAIVINGIFLRLICSVFLTDDAQTAIQATFQDAGVANIQAIRPPLSVTAGQSRLETGDLYAEGPWLALIALAGIIILFCIIGIIVICFTWARYNIYTSWMLIKFWSLFHCQVLIRQSVNVLSSIKINTPLKPSPFFFRRYKRYREKHQRSPMYVAPKYEPVFMEPPSFLKEYETQVC